MIKITNLKQLEWFRGKCEWLTPPLSREEANWRLRHLSEGSLRYQMRRYVGSPCVEKERKLYNEFALHTSDGWPTVRCVVTVVNSTGKPDMIGVKVRSRKSDIKKGWHSSTAIAWAAEQGYKPYLVFDERNPASAGLLPLFDWDNAPVTVV